MPAIRSAKLIVSGALLDLGTPIVCPARTESTLEVDLDEGTLVTHLFGTTNIGRLIDLKRAPYRIVLPPLAPGEYKLVLEHSHRGQREKRELRFSVAAIAPRKPRMKLGLVDGANVELRLARDLVAPLKLHSVRPWIGTGDFAQYKTDDDVRRAIEYQAAGVIESIVFCCAQAELKSTACSRAVAWYAAFADDVLGRLDEHSATRGSTLRIEVHNEPDLDDRYWDKSVADYAVKLLRPVYLDLKKRHGQRVEIISAGLSWNVTELRKNAHAIADHCDAIGFHGYPKNRQQFTRINDAQQVAASVQRRMIITEGQCNFAQSSLTTAQRQAEVAAYLEHCEAAGVDELIYFVAYPAGTSNSWGALLDRVKNTAGKITSVTKRPFYETFRAFAQRE